MDVRRNHNKTQDYVLLEGIQFLYYLLIKPKTFDFVFDQVEADVPEPV